MAFVFPSDFDPQPSLTGPGLVLHPLREADRDPLTVAAADPLIWAGHPARDRHDRAVFDPYFSMLLSSGAGLAIRDEAGRVIGCSVYYTDTNAPSRLSIGFTFLVRDRWGGGTNRGVKRLMLDHLFATGSEAWFHIAPINIRSQTATKRLGAVFTHEADLDLGAGARRNRYYCLTRECWMANERAQVAAR